MNFSDFVHEFFRLCAWIFQALCMNFSGFVHEFFRLRAWIFQASCVNFSGFVREFFGLRAWIFQTSCVNFSDFVREFFTLKSFVYKLSLNRFWQNFVMTAKFSEKVFAKWNVAKNFFTKFRFTHSLSSPTFHEWLWTTELTLFFRCAFALRFG